MEIVGKIVLMPKGDYDPNKTYEHLDWVRYNGSSWVCKQDNTIGVTPIEGAVWTCLAENGADGQDGQAGDSLTATHSKSGTTTTVVIENATTGAVIDTFDIEDGASGSGTGDMVSSDFVGSGATTSVWKSEHLVKSDGSLISGDDVGSDYIDSVSSDFNVVGKELQLSSGVTAKLSELDNTTTDKDKVLTANGDGTTSWKVAKGGHDMLTSVSDVEDNTEASKYVVDALVVKEYSNMYTNRVILNGGNPIAEGETFFGTWDSATQSDWAHSDEFIIGANEDIDLQFVFEVVDENSTPVYLGGWQWDTVSGNVCVKFGSPLASDTRIAVNVTHMRKG